MKTFILSIACCLALQVSAQLKMDLSKEEESSESIDTYANTIEISNGLPDRAGTYDISITREDVDIEPFSLDEVTSVVVPTTPPRAAALAMSAFETSYDALLNAGSEKDIPELITDLRKKMVSETEPNIRLGNTLISSTNISQRLPFTLKLNTIVKVIVKRYSDVEKKILTWKKVFKTPVKNPFKVMYGFTFTANWMNYTDEYYSRTDTGGLFRVTRSERSVGKFWENISPTIVFQWTPVNWKSPFKLGAMGGLSLNFTKEAGLVNVMVGPSLVISDNLSISSGIAFVQKRVLSRDYKNGDLIREKLSVDALHDKKYMPEFFITVAFRFDKNPFGQKDKTTEAP